MNGLITPGVFIAVKNLLISDFYQMQGDLNNDENVDILDIIILVNHILSPAAVELEGSDINEDGNVDILDVIHLVNIILDQ